MPALTVARKRQRRAASYATSSTACTVTSTGASSTALAAPRQPVAPLAVHLLGRVRRRPLPLRPREAVERRRHRPLGGRRLPQPAAATGSPVRSSVVGRDAQPRRRQVASWAAASTNRASRVARPTSTTSRPVAKGSSVPVCPTARVPRTRRTRGHDIVRGRARRLVHQQRADQLGSSRSELAQHLVDPRRVLQAAVELEVELGHDPRGQRLADPAAEEPRGALEPFERAGPALVLGLPSRSPAPSRARGRW